MITNQIARPLEFHCTMPVKPSRAQELLYGPTMDAFVCGEQIARALVTKAKVKPALVLADCPAVLALSTVSDVSVAQLLFEHRDEHPYFRLPLGSAGELAQKQIDSWRFALLTTHPNSARQLEQTLVEVGVNIDLTEPFQRVTEALLEAHPIARAA